MKIALFTETYLPDVNGVVSHVKVLREGLEKLGHEVLVVTADVKAKKHYLDDSVLHCPSKKIKKIYGYGLALPYSKKRFEYIKEFNPDVVHIHNEFGIGMFGIKAAKKLKKPVIYTVHTIYDECLCYVVPKFLTSTGKKIFYRYMRNTADKADVLLGPSRKSQEFLNRAGVHKNLRVVANGVDVTEFSLDGFSKSEIEKKRTEIRNLHNIPVDAFVGCNVTRLGKEKSLDILIKYVGTYMLQNKNFYLMIVGDGPEKQELEEISKNLKITDRVIFAGKVLNKDIKPYYLASDVFVSTSLADTNSISMLEAMAMELPVLQRYDEVNKDQVVDGVNGYVFSDAETMSKCLDKLINMPKEDMANLKKNVRQSVLGHSVQNVAQNTLDQYINILNKKREMML